MDSLMLVGASQLTVEATRKTILDILATQRADAVTITALKALTRICQVKNTTISGCTLSYKDGSTNGR